MMHRMRRIGRWTLNGLTVLSIAVGIIAVSLWVRLDSRRDVIVFTVGSSRLIWFMNEDDAPDNGGVCLRFASPWPVSQPWRWTALAPVDEDGLRITYPRFIILGHSRNDWSSANWHGLEWWNGTMFVPLTADGRPELYYGPSPGRVRENTPRESHSMSVRQLSVPHWMLVAGTLLLPGSRMVLLVLRPCFHSSKKSSGFCRACRYDLTGNVSGVCPECGMAVAKQV
jgi:hypothetical protein